MKPKTKSCLLDDAVFWKRLENFLYLLKAIASWIAIFESNVDVISKGAECFDEIKDYINKNGKNLPKTLSEEGVLLRKLDHRIKKIVRPVHCAANLLEPRYKGKHLNDEQLVSAIEWIHQTSQNHVKYKENSDDIIDALGNYQAEHGLFAKEFIKKTQYLNKPGRVWWSSMCGRSKINALAIDVLGLPASSAATERSFSTYVSFTNVLYTLAFS